jgi:hypothetical protein
LISPKLDGEVCIWQRGGGRPAEEDLSKWTEVLERALDMPNVDWLLRSETSPDEAFDIEVTGGWVHSFSPFSRTVTHESYRSAAPQFRYLILLVFPR